MSLQEGRAARALRPIPAIGPLVLDPMPIGTTRVLFDLSRLLRNRGLAFATGVDRIDIAIGAGLVARYGGDCLFVHAAPGGLALVSHAAGAALLDALARRWRGEGGAPAGGLRIGAEILAGRARAILVGRTAVTAETTYVNASHSGLPLRPGGLDRLDPERRMRRLAYIHDLIPLEYPEYQTAASARRFAGFLDELAGAPIRFVTNSADTARRLAARAAARGWTLEGVEAAIPRLQPAAARQPQGGALRPAVRRLLDDPTPCFIMIGTIEPRKNHLLLLHLWRDMAAAGVAPRLALVGRRGWENEMVVDMLERCPALAPHVAELGDLSDDETHALLAGARALLMPSFAEGLGLPVMEAAALGVPAVVSDLPALREIAAAGTVFLDPLDGPAWRREILKRAAGPAPLR